MLIALLPTIGCDSNPTGPEYNPELPTAWAAAVTNPLFPLTPGTTLTYEGETGEGLETTVVEVLSGTRTINGVAATIVRDRVYLDGELIEDTFDWFAQDADGNVWYLGEDTKEYENGAVVSTEGSWEWGIDGALPGIYMWADPAAHVGEEYRQEFAEGEAEDWAKVLAVGEAVTVPFGSFTNCIKTEDWNGLESGGHEFKYYCPGIGLALETPVSGSERIELTERTPDLRRGGLQAARAGWKPALRLPKEKPRPHEDQKPRRDDQHDQALVEPANGRILRAHAPGHGMKERFGLTRDLRHPDPVPRLVIRIDVLPGDGLPVEQALRGRLRPVATLRGRLEPTRSKGLDRVVDERQREQGVCHDDGNQQGTDAKGEVTDDVKPAENGEQGCVEHADDDEGVAGPVVGKTDHLPGSVDAIGEDPESLPVIRRERCLEPHLRLGLLPPPGLFLAFMLG